MKMLDALFEQRQLPVFIFGQICSRSESTWTWTR